MKKEEIKFGDIKRLFIGEVPPVFLLEVLFRSVILYLALLLIVKWLGKRMSGRITILEMAIMLMLGAIVSAPMQVPDKGVLQGLLILSFLLSLYWFAGRLSFWNPKVEQLLNGELTILVKDGALQLDNMERACISKQQLFAQLRKREIFNLGEVERCYLEACGVFTIYKFDTPYPGLDIAPDIM